jgi:hypothetical protein
MCATCGYLVAAVCHITASHNRVSAEGWVYCEGDTPNFTYLNMLVSVLVRCLCLLPMTLRVSTSHISKLHILLLLSYDWFFPQKGCPLGYTGYRCQNPPGNGQICHRSAVSSTVCYCHCVDLYKAAHPSTPSWCHTYMQAPLSLSLFQSCQTPGAVGAVGAAPAAPDAPVSNLPQTVVDGQFEAGNANTAWQQNCAMYSEKVTAGGQGNCHFCNCLFCNCHFCKCHYSVTVTVYLAVIGVCSRCHYCDHSCNACLYNC